MTEIQQAALEQAKIDAHAAVKDFLDAIGRIVLINVESHRDDTAELIQGIITAAEARAKQNNTPEPTQPETRKPKYPTRKRVLTDLHLNDLADMPLDVANYPKSYEHQLRRLQKEKLAQTISPGLWRITLGGKAHLAGL